MLMVMIMVMVMILVMIIVMIIVVGVGVWWAPGKVSGECVKSMLLQSLDCWIFRFLIFGIFYQDALDIWIFVF